MSNVPQKTLMEILQDNFNDNLAGQIYKLIIELDGKHMPPDKILKEVILNITKHIQKDLTEDIITKGGNPKAKSGLNIKGKIKG